MTGSRRNVMAAPIMMDLCPLGGDGGGDRWQVLGGGTFLDQQRLPILQLVDANFKIGNNIISGIARLEDLEKKIGMEMRKETIKDDVKSQ
jgi:hypothetical protein